MAHLGRDREDGLPRQRTRGVTTGYLPYLDPDGLWHQIRQMYAGTGTAVTSSIAWSPDETRHAYGTYQGFAVVARTPAP